MSHLVIEIPKTKNSLLFDFTENWKLKGLIEAMENMTIKMVDDQQNVDPVMFSAHRLRISLYWDSIRRPSESGLSTLAFVLLKAGIKVWWDP